jgi:hypothetical protein
MSWPAARNQPDRTVLTSQRASVNAAREALRMGRAGIEPATLGLKVLGARP